MAVPATTDPYAALRALFPAGQPQQAVPAAAPAVAPMQIGSKYAGAFDALVAAGKNKPAQSDGGTGIGDVLSGAGHGLLWLLDKAMIPQRAIASFTKEVNDAWANTALAKWMATGNHLPDWLMTQRTPEEYQKLLEQQGATGGFEWKDFSKQVAERKGMGDYVTQINPKRSLGYRRIMGFLGDVATDPLMHAGVGVTNLAGKAGRVAETAGQQAAFEGLDAAIKSASSKSITNALIKSAKEAGFEMAAGGGFTDEALNRLLVETQKRGVGGLTKRALLSAGVSEEMAAKLGIGRLGRTYLHGAVTIPKSSMLTDIAEGFKGGIKASIRESAGAQFLRGKFGAESVQKLRKIAFNKAETTSNRVNALIAEQVMAAPKREATMWGKLTERRIRQNWSGVVRDAEGNVDKAATKAAEKAGVQSWHNVVDSVAADATHSLETGGTGVLQDSARAELKQIHDDMVAAGVNVGNLGENYFPHFITDEARVLAGKNPEVRTILDSLASKSSFEHSRTLVAGSEFLNETSAAAGQNLVEGSAKEINARMLEKYNVKLFDDNLQTVMPKYLKSAENAIRRAKTYEALGSVGLSGPLLERVERQLNPDKAWVKELADLQARKDLLVAEQQVHLSNGATLRRDGLVAARKEYAKQATVLRARLREVDSELVKLEKVAAGKQAKLAEVTTKLDAAKAAVKNWQQQVKVLKGDARVKAAQELQVAKQTLKEQTAELKALRSTVSDVSVMNVSTRQITERLAPMRQRMLELQAERSALQGQIDELGKTIGEISSEEIKTLAATGRAANRSLELAKARAQQLVKGVKSATSEADVAVNAHLLAQADADITKSVVKDTLTELQTRIDSLTGLPSIPKKANIKLKLQNDLRERFNTLLQVLDSPDTSPELRAIAGLEAAAAESDMWAADLGDHIGTLNDMIAMTKNKKEIEVMLKSVQTGSVQVGENLQVPQWLFDATTVQHAVKDVTKAGEAFKRYMDLFRAYVTIRPGFHVRNAYTALFNMYLEGGVEAFAGIKKWHQFYSMVQKNPENYMLLAERKFGAETAGKLNDALEVMYGSGAGNVGSRTAATTFGKAGFNPLDPNNRYIAASRKIGTMVEDNVRGAHAFAVLERGGSKDLASDIIAKWHFNYSDLGSWDRMAKNFVPFWTFFSRNLALQAQTYVRNIPRYNRAITNFERNMTVDSQDPTVVPAYFQKAGAIRVSGGNNPTYWFPDLPMTLFPSQVSQLTTPSQFTEMLGNLGPIVKVPLEALAGKSLYTGIPTADKYVPVPLGFKQLIQASGIEIPSDVIQNTPKGPVMKASYAQALNSIIPVSGQLERLLPTSEGSGGQGLQGWMTWLTGIGTRQLGERAIAGENIRRKEEARLKAKYARSLASFNG